MSRARVDCRRAGRVACGPPLTSQRSPRERLGERQRLAEVGDRRWRQGTLAHTCGRSGLALLVWARVLLVIPRGKRGRGQARWRGPTLTRE